MRIVALALLALLFCMVLDRRPDPPGVMPGRNLTVSSIADTGIPSAPVLLTLAGAQVRAPQLVLWRSQDTALLPCKACGLVWALDASDSSPPA